MVGALNRVAAWGCQLVVLGLLGACAPDPESLPSYRMGTGAADGNYQVAGQAIARLTRQQRQALGFFLEYQTSAGSAANLNAILAGDVEFGVAQADDLFDAYNGQREWAARGPQTELRAVFSVFTEAVTLVAGGDSTISSLADLPGARIDLGPPDSGTRRSALSVLAAAGIDSENDIEARSESLEERLASFMRGELDAFFYTVSHPNTNVRFATFSVRGARLVPLDNVDALLNDNPYFSRTVIPAALYPSAANTADVTTVGVRAVLLTSTGVADDVVYGLTKTVFENLDALRAFNPVLERAISAELPGGEAPPLHAGAARYFREAGIAVTGSAP